MSSLAYYIIHFGCCKHDYKVMFIVCTPNIKQHQTDQLWEIIVTYGVNCRRFINLMKWGLYKYIED